MSEEQTVSETKGSRIRGFDVLRGLTVVSMMLFHAMYDLVYLYGFRIGWFENVLIQNAWRCSISWTFLFLAGWMFGFSKSNLKRGAKYTLVAALVFIATSIAQVDIPINFGIIYCMAASTLLTYAISKIPARIDPGLGCVLCLVLFIATYQLPRSTYEIQYLAWLGLPSGTFSSGDYYPLLPYTLMYGAGYFSMQVYKLQSDDYSGVPFTLTCKPLEAIGRHSLELYLIHQPLILLLFSLAFSTF